MQDAKGRLIYAHKGGRLMVTPPINGEPACGANGGTIGFGLESAAEVDAWHKAGVESGGTTVEDPPGVRQGAAGALYLAYLRDPDGNKLCGLYRMAA
jgi:catechol 2,3-dioxygenase-like lactoylglutathione lyase family enzyme